MASKHKITVGEELRYDADLVGLRNPGGTYARKRTRLYDLRDYGLTAGVGSGLKAAVNAALAQVRIDGGGVIYIPGGTYAFSGWTETEGYAFTATNYVSFVGDDKGTVLRLDNTAVTGPILLPLIGSRVSVGGIVFDTVGTSNSTGVRIFAPSAGVRVEGCSFESPGSGGVYIDDGVISDVVVTGNHFMGARFGVITRGSGTTTNLAISNNTFTGGNGGDAIEINSPTGTAKNISITGNTIRNVAKVGSSDGLGIGVAHATQVSIVGNTIDNCGLDGIHVEDASHNLTITGNTVKACGRSGISIQYALNLSGETTLTSRVTINANNVEGCGTVSGSAGIAVESGSADSSAADYIITSNTVRSCGRAGASFAGILIGSNANKGTVAHNHVSNTIGDSACSGITIASSDALVTGNMSYDDQGTPTQKYGLKVSGSTANVRMRDNNFTGNATAPYQLVSGSLTDLTNSAAQSAGLTFRAGRKWLFAGDSITNGSTASNSVFAFPRQACHMAGTLYAASDSVEGGTSGYTSTQLLAFMPTLLSTYTPDAVHVQVGTNDSGNSVPLSTFSANIMAIAALVKAAGKQMTIGTVPPRGSASGSFASSRPFIAAYNMWLRMWAPGAGVELAEVHGALADPTTGDYLSTYDSGDGVHPNDAGHREIARPVAAAMLRTMPSLRPSLVNAVSTANLISNPLMVTAGSNPTGSVAGVATGTAPTTSSVADTSGVLPAGLWTQIDLTAAATSSFGRDFVINAAGWSVGDTLGLTGLMQVEDVTGSGAWDAAVAAGTASVSVNVINASTGLSIRAWGDRSAGRALSAGIYNLGPFFTTLVIPAGVTGMTYRYQLNLPSGLHVKARFGVLGVFNLTTLGISGGSAAMTNVDGP